jgi:probable F420-dependent oxidoreductase
LRGLPRISVRIFGFGLDRYEPLARRSEELGFDGVWIPDHLVAPLAVSSVYPYHSSGRPRFDTATPFADPWVMLGHLSACTTRLELGVGVFVLPLRNPFAAAKAAATVQILSRGRLLFGVGLGWMREEFDAVGERFDKRAARTAEMITIMRALWSGEPVEHRGDWYGFDALQMSPAAPSIPIFLGGSSPAALRRAAQLGDGWYGPPSELDQAVELRDALLVHRQTAERADLPFRIIARIPSPASAGDLHRFAERGFTDLVVDVPRTLTGLDDQLEWLEQLAADLAPVK